MNLFENRKRTSDEQPEQSNTPALWSGAHAHWESLRGRSFQQVRRLLSHARTLFATQRAVGPASFLLISAVLGSTLTLTTLYSTSYAVTVNGQPVGVVTNQEMVEAAIATVEEEGRTMLGSDFHVAQNVDYRFGLTLRSDLSSQDDIESFFYGQLDELSAHLKKCQVLVNGKAVGAVKDEAALNVMLAELKSQYVNDKTTEVAFMEDITFKYIYDRSEPMTIPEMRAALESNGGADAIYAVQKGNTFNQIAYSHDMSVSELKALNPGIDINRLFIGQELNIKGNDPILSVRTKEHQVYMQAIECPVETVDDDSMYKGTSKIVTQGTPGQSEVEADVIYVNGKETERNILGSTVLRQPTATVKAVGTKEKPKTSSTGSFSWPIRGRVTSYFGGRKIFGGYNYHSGMDISASYGAAIKAADGGTVTFAGWKGSYGKLVIITHDNGVQTYYGHNSALLVSAGQKVYKGQQIAKAGSTGRSTGTHCHFEVRVKGSSVNPLNYLGK